MNEILTPCILHNIIICSTIIILSVVAVSAFRIHKVEECQKNNSETEKKSSSCLGMYIFLSSIVVLIAVLIFSYAFYTDKKVLDFISLASALVSIILAVITIIYSFVVNSQTAGQIDKLTKTSKSLQTASTKAVESAEEMKNAAQQVVEASKLYDETAKSLDSNIQKILEKVLGIDRKLGTSDNYEDKGNPNSNPKYTDNDYSNFCKRIPFVGCMLLYACYKIEETNIELKIGDVFTNDDAMYHLGFAVALKTIGLISVSIDIDNQTISDAIMPSNLKTYIDERIKNEINGDNEYFIEHKKKIDDYFTK